MKYATRILVYPEGDTQEIEWELRSRQMIDVSGRPLRLPVARNEYITSCHLEQLYPDDLAACAERG